MATTMRFILLGDDQASRAFDRFARSVDKANRSVARQETQMRKAKVQTDSFGKSVGLLAAEVAGAGDAFTIFNKKANIAARVMGGIGLATGLAEPLVSSLVVAVGGLSSALVVAGASAGAYGIALKPVLGQVGDLMKLQQQAAKGSKAAQKQLQETLKHTNPAIVGFTKQLTASQKTYKNWADSLAGVTLTPLMTMLNQVKPLLHALTPLVKAAAGAFTTLANQLGAKIRGGGVERVVSVLLPKVRPVLLDLGHSIGNIVAGFWGIAKAFLPFSTTVTGGLERLTAKFKEWATTLSGHSGFHAVVNQWRQDWPAIKPVLENLLTIVKNVLSSMAAMATPSNSKALWQIANPLTSVALALSSHPAFVQALVYLLAIGKAGQRISGVFAALKTGWGTFSAIISKLTGGKISLGMQSAGDTMLVASQNMQKAADVMAGASGIAGKAGGAVGGAEAAAAGAGAGGFLGKLNKLTGLRWIVRGGIALAIGDLVLRTAVDLVPKQQGAVPKGQGWARRISEAVLGKGVDNVATWWDTHISQPIRNSAKRDFAWLAGRSGAAAGSLAQPLDDLAKKSQALARAGNPVANMLSRQMGAAKTARDALNNYTKTIYTNGLRSDQTKQSRRTLLNDMLNAGVKANTARRDVADYTGAIRKNGYGSDQARAARQRLIDDIYSAFKNSQQGKRDLGKYTDAVRINGLKSDVARTARKQLITDLVNSGLSAKDAKKLVNNLTTAIDNMHGKKVTVSVLGKGSGLLSYKLAVPHEMTSKGTLEFHAAGGLVRGAGGPRSDSNLIAASRGEYVQQASAVSRYGVAAMNAINKGQAIVRYADGGMVGLAHEVGKPVPWMAAAEEKYARAAENVWGEAAMRALAKAVQQAAFGSGMAIARYARRFVGQIPYVWGGGRVPGGADCSGFTQTVYGRFGIAAPRTSEAQFAWVRRSAPVPGGLAFYTNPGGGTPPGHVAMVDINPSRVISQGGPGLGPIITGLHGPGPLMGTGIPPHGFGTQRAASAGTYGRYGETQLSSLWIQAGGAANRAHIMSAIAMAESGGNPNAVGPMTRFGQAKGLWQILGSVYPGNLFNPFVNAKNAVGKWHLQGLSAWEAYLNGSYRQFMSQGGAIREPVLGIGLHSGAGYALGESGTEYVSSQADLKDAVVLLRAVLAELRKQTVHAASGPERTGRETARALNGTTRRVALERG